MRRVRVRFGGPGQLNRVVRRGALRPRTPAVALLSASAGERMATTEMKDQFPQAGAGQRRRRQAQILTAAATAVGR